MQEVNVMGTKGRLLFLEKYLTEHTDDSHVVTTEELLEIYKKNGYKCQRTTIRDDIAVLLATGVDIITENVSRNETHMNAYHIGNRLFELAELKMLVDAVSSSRFITAEKSEVLVGKLAQLTNEENRASLTAKIYNADRLKTSNTSVFVHMDVIFRAITDRKKITFHYWDYAPTKEKFLRHDGELYVVSPYALVWNDDRYYVVAYSDKREKIIKYRVDRMCDVFETEESATVDDEFNAAIYSRKVIKMFDDELEEQQVSLLCENDRMRNVLDRFGEGTETEIVDDEHFRATINVVPSSTFFGWVMQYQGGILVETPGTVKGDYEGMLSKILMEQRKILVKTE